MAGVSDFPIGSRCWYLQWVPSLHNYRWQRVEVFRHTNQRVGVRLVRGGEVVPGTERYPLACSLSNALVPRDGAEVIE